MHVTRVNKRGACSHSQHASAFLYPKMHVAGYYMPFTSTRVLMDKFQISDRGVDDTRLEFPINNWLAETGRTYVLAGAISHPRKRERNKEDGTLFMTQFARLSPGSNQVLEEWDIDRHVKKWLIKEGAVNADELEWISLEDHYKLTLNGICPQLNNERGIAIHRIVPSDVLERWNSSDKDLEDFLEDEAAAGRWCPN